MPHLTIEYSSGLEARADVPGLCAALHEALVLDPLFPTAGIRVRAFRAQYALVGDGLPENDFAALTLAVGAGRARVDLAQAGERIFAVAQAALAEPLAGTHFALSLDIRVNDPELSWKDTPIHRRLSGAATGA